MLALRQDWSCWVCSSLSSLLLDLWLHTKNSLLDLLLYVSFTPSHNMKFNEPQYTVIMLILLVCLIGVGGAAFSYRNESDTVLLKAWDTADGVVRGKLEHYVCVLSCFIVVISVLIPITVRLLRLGWGQCHLGRRRNQEWCQVYYVWVLLQWNHQHDHAYPRAQQVGG